MRRTIKKIIMASIVMMVACGAAPVSATESQPRNSTDSLEPKNAGKPLSQNVQSDPRTQNLAADLQRAEELHVLAKFIKIMLQFSGSDEVAAKQISNFHICLTKKSDQNYGLSSLNGRLINDRRVTVDVFASASSIDADCDLAYLSKSEVDHVDYRQLAKDGVLTVSDYYHFAKKGGALEIEFQDDRIAFYVGYHRIRRSDFSPSSKFLRLATEVYR